MEQQGGWTVRRRWSDPSRDGLVARFRRRFGRVRNPLDALSDRPSNQKDRTADAADIAPGCFPDEIGLAILIFAIWLVVFAFLWELFLFALLAALGELLLLVILVIAGVVARVVLRHPWTVQATHTDGRTHAWEVRGFRQSKRFVTYAQRGLDRGRDPDEIVVARLPPA